ncbi:MAG: Hsp20/alpha crystallin family protein [Planctomycetaceae bacterium]
MSAGPENYPAESSAPELVAAAPIDAGPPAERVYFTPPIDIYDSPEGLVLIADLPGVSTPTLELQVQDNKLTLLGRVPPSAPGGARLIHKEYDEGDFVRSFILSDEVDHERISARLHNGVLEIVLPRAAKAAPRRIEVNSD